MIESGSGRNPKRSTSYLPIVVLNNQPSPPVNNYHYQTSAATDEEYIVLYYIFYIIVSVYDIHINKSLLFLDVDNYAG